MPDPDDKALDSLSVTPPKPDQTDEKGQSDAGRDASIAERLQEHPGNRDAQLDEALDESMDASDPLSTTQPARSTDPAPSSGYDADAEAKRQS